jgi:hypothetical protein
MSAIASSRRALAHDTARLAALVETGRRHTDANEFEEAECAFIRVLDEVRGSGSDVELRAVEGLYRACMLQGREAELLPLARRLCVLAAKRNDPVVVCDARQAVTCALANLEDWDRTLRSLPDFDDAIAQCAPELRPRHELMAASMRCSAAFETGDFAGADAALARVDAIARSASPTAWWKLSRMVIEARLHLVRGDAREAVRVARRAISIAPAFVAGIDAHVVEIEALFACDGADAAAAAAQRVMDLVDAAGSDLSAPSLIVHAFGGLGLFLHERCGLPDLARRAYDLAAAAALRRVEEIEMSHGGIPELTVLDTDDAAALAQFRSRFQSRRHALMQSVARLLREEAARGRSVALARTVAAGWVRVCAWCLRARPADGGWMPIGHFVPAHDDAIRVTHGICEECLVRVVAAPAGG